jgi:hypothetical protein
MAKLEIGAVNFFDEFDASLNWRIVPIRTERRFPFRFDVIVSGRTFEITFRMNPVEVAHIPGDESEIERLFIRIADVDDNRTVIYNDIVVEQLMFKVSDLYVYFNEIKLDVQNMINEGDFDSSIEMGVAIE